jgi:DNA-binding GntR family transcriptional regulator
MTPAKAGELSAALQRMQDAANRDDRAAVDVCDAELHSLIVKLADHRRLQQQYTIIEQQTRRYIACSNALTVDCAAILKQHEPIVQALISGEPDAAEREAQRHNLDEGKVLVVNLQTQEAEPGGNAASELRKAGADT